MVEEGEAERTDSRQADLVLEACGGRDLLSKPVLLSNDGKYVFSAEQSKEKFNIIG